MNASTKMTKTKDLSAKTLTELTAMYNALSDKPIKKFSCSREEAAKRVQKLLDAQKTKPAKALGPKSKKQGIGAVTIECLQKGMKPADVLDELRKTFGDGVSSMQSIYWYASKLRCGAL